VPLAFRFPQDRVFIVAPHARVLGRCFWQPAPTNHPTLIALHGLEGSSEAHYMRGMADKAFAEGFNVVLLNQRNCGGTEHLSMTLYHSGLSADVDVVLRELSAEGHRAIVIAGYSLGGNLALKLAGDYGRDAPTTLKAIAAVSPVMDLPRCVEALERPFELFLSMELRAEPEGADAAEGRGISREGSRPRRWIGSAPCGSSTRNTRRRSSASAMRPTTTTARRRCAWSTASKCRPWSSSPATIRSCQPTRSARPQSPATRTSRCA
jgi:pimeloyl-ACP methyl ester carboxylesterase